MQYYVDPLEKLIEQFKRLPGIGAKNAQRLAFFVMSLPPERANEFAKTIIEAKEKIRLCDVCCNFTDRSICHICEDTKRDDGIICVIEEPADVVALEKTREYHGRYHVLHGHISPIDGVGPDDIKIKELLARINNETLKEVLIATNSTVEGEVTALYVAKLLKTLDIKVTRLAYGIPVGGNLEYADEITLLRAIEGRRDF